MISYQNSLKYAEENLVNLKELSLQLVPHCGKLATSLNGLSLVHFENLGAQDTLVNKPTVVLIIQGQAKLIYSSRFEIYRPAQYAIFDGNAPDLFCITEASENKPFLALFLELNKPLLNDLLISHNPPTTSGGGICRQEWRQSPLFLMPFFDSFN